jgi:hypothetical protein
MNNNVLGFLHALDRKIARLERLHRLATLRHYAGELHQAKLEALLLPESLRLLPRRQVG